MVFDLIPNLFASVLSILFPIFASYKALRAGDPAQLAPWLMYWVSFALLTFVETNFSLLLMFVPFYSLFRLVFLLYLVLPQTQGARLLYQTRIEPFLAEHESRIEHYISDAHARLKTSGLDYVSDAVAWIQRMLLGRAPEPAPRAAAAAETYAASLLARFNLPSARDGAATGDLYGMLSAAAATIGRGVTSAGAGGAREGQMDELARSGGLVPAHITDSRDKARYVGQQRERVRVLLGALDRQAQELERDEPAAARARADDAMPRNKSEASFDRIDRDEAAEAGAGWLGWGWGGKAKEAGAPSALDAGGKASSSGVDM